ncbi:MAG: flagellar motor switch protein FliN [Erysipelotrichaceae bacterium]|nr:flagellar motor switch protein FliN [Erysipelotrichaceae bacterium]
MNDGLMTQEEMTMLLEKSSQNEPVAVNGTDLFESAEDPVNTVSNMKITTEAVIDSRVGYVTVQKPVFEPLEATAHEQPASNIDLIMDVSLEVSVVLGKTKKTIQEILSLSRGSIVELNKFAEEPLQVYVNDKLIAKGEVVVINENFGIRITNILDVQNRVENFN